MKRRLQGGKFTSVLDRFSSGTFWSLLLMLSVSGVTSGLAGCTVASPPDAEAPAGEAAETEEPSGSGLAMPELPAMLSGRDAVSIDQLGAERADDAVSVSGTVAERVALLDGWLYQVQDETGAVWVLAAGSDPQIGQSVTVEGTVRYEAIQVGEVDAGEIYLAETRYRAQ